MPAAAVPDPSLAVPESGRVHCLAVGFSSGWKHRRQGSCSCPAVTSCLPELRPRLRPQRRPARSPSIARHPLLSPRHRRLSAIWNCLPVSTSLIHHLISYFLRKCLFSPLSLLHPVLKYLFASASLQSCDHPRDPRAQGCWTAQNPGKEPALLGGQRPGHPHVATPASFDHRGFHLPRGAGGTREGPQQSAAGGRQHRPSSCREGEQAPRGHHFGCEGSPSQPPLPALLERQMAIPVTFSERAPRGERPLLRQPGSRFGCYDYNQREEMRSLTWRPGGKRVGSGQAWIPGLRKQSHNTDAAGAPAPGQLLGRPHLVQWPSLWKPSHADMGKLSPPRVT